MDQSTSSSLVVVPARATAPALTTLDDGPESAKGEPASSVTAPKASMVSARKLGPSGLAAKSLVPFRARASTPVAEIANGDPAITPTPPPPWRLKPHRLALPALAA